MSRFVSSGISCSFASPVSGRPGPLNSLPRCRTLIAVRSRRPPRFTATLLGIFLGYVGITEARQAGTTAASGSARLDPQTLFAQGQAALQSGDLDAANTAFRNVLAVDPRSGAAYANLGVVAMRRKQWNSALSLLHRAEQLEPKMTGIRLNIGLVSFRRGDYAGAIAPLSSVVLRPAGLHTRPLPARPVSALHRTLCRRRCDA
jgi:tetratricopeptide (TPR) repeat protein